MLLTGELRAEYEALWTSCVADPARAGEISRLVARIEASAARYREIAAHCGAVPWQVVAAIHAMECGLRQDLHLHNGDPLTARTVRVPAGRPLGGAPPFSWEESAIDALTHAPHDLRPVMDWGIAGALYQLEKYNGFGYRTRGVRSPYLWSGTNHYTRGKFTADGQFDPAAVSKQIGAAALLRPLWEERA